MPASSAAQSGAATEVAQAVEGLSGPDRSGRRNWSQVGEMRARIRALVVDDDHDIGEMVSLALSDEGYDVVLTSNGSEALDASLETPFDLILLDMRMPIMDGWTFAQEYRSRPEPRAPVIVVTAARDAAERAAEIDADGYLAKPFSLEELFAVINQHVRQP